MKYSVLLLRPDYIAEPYGQDTYFTHVEATNAEVACNLAQQEAAEADSGDAAEDYAVLLCIAGHHDDVTPVTYC